MKIHYIQFCTLSTLLLWMASALFPSAYSTLVGRMRTKHDYDNQEKVGALKPLYRQMRRLVPKDFGNATWTDGNWVSLHYGSMQPDSGISKITLSHLLGSEWVTSERTNDRSGAREPSKQCGANVKVRVRMSERTSEWPITCLRVLITGSVDSAVGRFDCIRRKQTLAFCL